MTQQKGSTNNSGTSYEPKPTCFANNSFCNRPCFSFFLKRLPRLILPLFLFAAATTTVPGPCCGTRPSAWGPPELLAADCWDLLRESWLELVEEWGDGVLCELSRDLCTNTSHQTHEGSQCHGIPAHDTHTNNIYIQVTTCLRGQTKISDILKGFSVVFVPQRENL